jgi:DNA-nicking Smr family endonuclease
MPRVLSAEERALWRRVTADLRGQKVEIAAMPLGKVKHPVATVRVAPSIAKPQSLRRAVTPGTTLDATWDRELRTGRVTPDRLIDLHGCTLAQAHDRVLSALADAVADGDRLVVVVTGRAPAPDRSRVERPLRGIIRASIGDWLHAAPFAGRIAAIRPAHARHGGAGALYVILRRHPRG